MTKSTKTPEVPLPFSYDATDTKTELPFSVTSDDLKRAKRNRHDCCAIAQAVKRQYSGVTRVVVGRTRVFVERGEKNRTRYALNTDLQRQVVAFDKGGKFDVGSYTLGMVPASQSTRNNNPNYVSKADRTTTRKNKSSGKGRKVFTDIRKRITW